MGKSPGKWIKTVIFGKKSSKSSINKKTFVTAKQTLKDFDDDSMVISSPIPPVLHTELEKNSSANLTGDTIEIVRNNTMEMNTADEDELIRLEEAATKPQAAFRGYMGNREFCTLKGIIKLQAHVRGHLVRRQAVATLCCMRAIVEFQALARGRRVRLHMLQKYIPEKLVDKKRADLLGTSLRSEKLSKNAFGTKLVASSNTSMALIIQYDPVDPNSVTKWLQRWSSSHFWEPLPCTEKKPNPKAKRKQIKSQTEKPKTSVCRIPAGNFETNLIKSSEKATSTHQPESEQDNPNNELDKVKRSLRKISVSTSEKSKFLSEKPPISLDNHSPKPNASEPFVEPNASEPGMVQPFVDVTAEPEADQPVAEETMNVELDGRENQNKKTRRRKSFPGKQEYGESGLGLPSYMAATESAKAKLRAQAVAKAAEDGAENGFVRRHSLPSSTTGKPSLQSPRFQKPIQANGKGWNKSKKLAREDKMLQTGWKR